MKLRLIILLLMCVLSIACKQTISVHSYALPDIRKEVRQENQEAPAQKIETGYTIGITSGWAALD